MNKAGYTDANGNSLGSSAYEFVAINITNSLGQTAEISRLVGFAKITEGLFNQSLVLELGIRDETNFFEDFNLNGNETIDLEIYTKSLGNQVDIKLSFFVTTYNDYSRGADTQVQVYSITAVCEHAFLAPLKHISRSVTGTSTSVIENILRNDLNTSVITHGKCLSSYSGLITSSNPLKAAMNILKNSFDENNTPYMLYQRLDGNVYLSPLSYLVNFDNNPIYKELTTKIGLKSNPGTFEDYYERSTLMQDLQSQINIAPSYQAKSGVYASNNNYIDLGTKTYRTHVFDASKQLKAEHTLSKKLNVDSETDTPYNIVPTSKVNYRFVNQNAYNGNDSMNSLVEKNKHISDAYLNNYDVCTHRFTLFGDPLLNSGRVVKLLFPKATDPINYKERSGKSITETQYDRSLSGSYMIFGATHIFKGGVYTTELIVKTDSLKPDDTV